MFQSNLNMVKASNDNSIIMICLPDHRKYVHLYVLSLYTQSFPVHWCRCRRPCPVHKIGECWEIPKHAI